MKPSFKTSNPRLDIGPTEIPHTGSFRFCTITFPFVLSVSMMRYVKVYSILLIVVHSVFNNLHALLMDKLLNPIWLSRSSSLLRNEIVTLYLYIKYKLQSFHLTPSAIITHIGRVTNSIRSNGVIIHDDVLVDDNHCVELE